MTSGGYKQAGRIAQQLKKQIDLLEAHRERLADLGASDNVESMRAAVLVTANALEILQASHQTTLNEVEASVKEAGFDKELFALHLAKEIERTKFTGKGARFAPYSYALAVAGFYREEVGETFRAVSRAIKDCIRLNMYATFGRGPEDDQFILSDHSVAWYDRLWGRNWLEVAIKKGRKERNDEDGLNKVGR